MVRPRGVTSRIFSSRSRAIVLEAEWMVMPQRIANELKPLVTLAKDQGWRIEAAQNGTKLSWRGPNGEGPVYTGYRCQGRDLANYRAELVRAGLKLDEKTAEDHIKEVSAQKMLDEAKDINVEEIHTAMSLISGSLAVLVVKAEYYDEARQAAEEWQRIAEEATDSGDRLKKELSEATGTIASIRNCFSLAPWAILPEIAHLLGIDSNGPSIRLPDNEGAKK